MSKFKKLLKKDAGESFASLFKDPLHGLFVFLGILFIVAAYLWFDYKSYEKEHGEASYFKERNLYIAGASIAVVLLAISTEAYKRISKHRKRKRYFKRLEKQREPKLRSDQ